MKLLEGVVRVPAVSVEEEEVIMPVHMYVKVKVRLLQEWKLKAFIVMTG